MNRKDRRTAASRKRQSKHVHVNFASKCTDKLCQNGCYHVGVHLSSLLDDNVALLDPDEPVKLPARPGDNITLVLHTPDGSYTGGVTLTKIPETRNLLLGVVCKSFYMGKENPFPFNPADLIIDAVCIDEEKWGDRDWHIIAGFADDADDGESGEGEPDEAEPDAEPDLATMAVAGNA